MGPSSTLSPPKPWRIISNQLVPMKIPSAHFTPSNHLRKPPKPIFCVAFDSSKIAASSAAPPLVVVGSANADIYVEIDRLPKEGETVSAKTGQTLAGGKGANQAVCGGQLRYPTYFMGQIGKDAHGKLIAEALEGGGVSLDYLNAVDGAPTGHAVVMLQADGQNSIIIVGGANMACWPEVLGGGDLKVVENAGIVLLQREIPDSINIQVAKAASSAGVPVILDAGGVDAPIPSELLKLIDILSPNETELARLTNMPTESFEQISRAAEECHKMKRRRALAQPVGALAFSPPGPRFEPWKRLLGNKGVTQVLVKLGAKGSALFTQGEEAIRQPIISAPNVIDTTGAGDTFTAAFAVALVEGKSKTECLKFAAAAASLCVRVKGAIPSMPGRDSVLNLLQAAAV